MKLLKYLVPILVAAGMHSATLAAQIIGQETRFDRELRSRDDQAVSAFIDSKENIPVKDKAKNLEISGDVRFEYTNIQEKGITLYHVDEHIKKNPKTGVNETHAAKDSQRYRSLRGGNYVDTLGIPISHNDFDVEFNLKVKYTYDHAWAQAHLQFDNPCGIKGRNECKGKFPLFNYKGTKIAEVTLAKDSRRSAKGSGDGIFVNLKRAFLGYNIYADGIDRFDIEAGRRKFSDVFDSEVQFTSRFDGLLLKYATAITDIADFYWNTGAFVIDERKNHFGAVTEFGFLNIMDSGFDVKYSFIDWRKFGRNRCLIENPQGMEFANSQIAVAYNFVPEYCGYKVPAQLYAGFLVNQAAKKNTKFSRKRENLAAYAGILFGEVNKKGDWSVDFEYIYVQAQAVPDFDVGSIGRGNILNENFTDIYKAEIVNRNGYNGNEYHSGSGYSSHGTSSEFIGYLPRRGNANFKGFRIDALYAFTDNLSVELIYEISYEINHKLGGRHTYSDFEIEAIYAF